MPVHDAVPYLAISHVWGPPESVHWQHIPEIDWKVLVSEEKAKFLGG
jgi:hypothetical protein